MSKELLSDLLVFSIVVFLLLFLGIPYADLFLSFGIVLIYCYKKKGLKDTLGFYPPKNWLKTLVLSLSFAIAILSISYLILLPLIEKVTGRPLDLGMFKDLRNNPTLLYISLALGWIVGGLIEETVFRGFMVSKFIHHIPNKTAGTIIAIVFTSILFGYLHKYQGPTGQILTGSIGCILACMYVMSKRNLWLNVLTHGFVNTITFLLLYFDFITIN